MIINYPIYEDILLKDYMEYYHLGKSKIYNLFQNKQILLNNHNVTDDTLLKKGDIVSIFYDEEIDYLTSDNDIDILFEDDYFLIVNKKSGILIHNGKDNNDSLCNDIAKYYNDNGYYLSVKFPNRIDKETSGIMIFCKDMLTLSYMDYLIENHEISKEYLAIVNGKLRNKKGNIDYRIGRDRHNSNMMRVSSTGKDAHTEYSLVKEYKDYSLVRCKISTGRTHQIRVHLSYIGNPIIGDLLYGKDDYDHMLLHAHKIEFIHPVYKEKVVIECDVPSYMKELIK